MHCRVWAALAALALPAWAHADTDPCPPVADLAGVVQCALARSPDLIEARQQLEAARARRVTAGQLLPANPSLSLSAAQRRSETGQTGADLIAELAQPVELGGQRGARLEVVRLDERSRELAVASLGREVVARILASATELWLARQSVVYAREQLEAAGALVEISRGRESRGVGPGLDVELAEAARVQARRELSSAEAAVTRAEGALSLFAGTDVRLRDDAALPEAVAPGQSLAELESAAAASRPAVQLARGDAASSQAQVEVLRRDRIPDLTLSVRGGQEEFSRVLGAGVSVPLPLFRRNQGELAEQQVRAGQAETSLRQAELKARLEVRRAYRDWERTLAAVRDIPAGLEERLTADLASLRDAYERGTLPLPTALASLRETANARRTVASARAEAVLASLELARAAGLLPNVPGATSGASK